ncbi:major facilitator superfamily domain-containing protein [Lasiosphaeris hirsuta]|uniref:Major facilitator superfamily domain-containing protein n=1 Tax=Lasiosphaeris hirsuta TaxID=260670 RepID=A0AA40BB76_9PEZI|nr:major facilitator superfamily domain-containing protein [Lasiosphaeris hirsuta]
MARSEPTVSCHGNEANAQDVNEHTPLLGAEDIAPATNLDVAKAITEDGQHTNGDEDGENKPLPLRQIMVLCYARWVEPVAFFSIFPYINKMAQENVSLADEDVGFYSGLIESLFSLTQMLLMIFWGRAADRFGRKPVLVFSLAGVSLATGLFGMAKTIWQMILFRCLAGVFAGTIVTIRTMLSEHSTSKTQAKAFSWFSFSGNLGILFGPLMGGALANPAEQYPNIFGGIWFFVEYPYALPSLVVSMVGLSAVLVTIFYADETLVRVPASTVGEESVAAKPIPPSTWELVKSPGVGVVLYAYAHIMLLAYSYTAISPVFWFTPVRLGGFGFSPLQISLVLGACGLSQAVWILLVFPPLQHGIGTNGVLRLCANYYPLFFGLCPFFSMLLRQGGHATHVIFWIVTPTALCLGSGVSMSFTAIQLALNDVSPNPAVLGTLNAVALSVTTGVRAVSPALFASLFALGAGKQWLWGYAIWALMTIMGAWLVVICRYLPNYQELKIQRQRERIERASERERRPTLRQRLYLEPPRHGATHVRRKVTTIVPAPAPPPPPAVIIEQPPPPPPVFYLPPSAPPIIERRAPPPPPPLAPVVYEDDTIDVIAVDIEPPERRRHRRRRSRSRSSSRGRDHEVVIERERMVPYPVPVPVRVPVPVPVRQELETYRYVEGPKPRPRVQRYSPPPPPRREESIDRERINITIEDRHRPEHRYQDEGRERRYYGDSHYGK